MPLIFAQPSCLPCAQGHRSKCVRAREQDVGDRVECNTGEWAKGTVIKTWYREDEWPEDKFAAYQVKLDMGQYIYAPVDKDGVCRAAAQDFSPKDQVEVVGLAGHTEHNGKEGTIVRWNAQKERYLVDIGLKKPLAVRQANLKKVNLMKKLQNIIRTGSLTKLKGFVDRNPRYLALPDEDGNTPLSSSIKLQLWNVAHWFASHRNAQRFVDTLDSEGESPLQAATRAEQLKLVETLLSSGADANLKSIRSNEYTQGNYDFIDATTGEKKVVSNEHRTAIFECAENGNVAIATLLINDGGCNLNSLDGDGCTALYVAMDEGNDEICELLLNSGVSPDIGNADIGLDNTLLAWSASRRRLNQVQMLLKHGADPNKPGKSGMYPLHMAARCGGKAVLQELLANGADPTLTCKTHKTCSGVTARQVVERNKQAVAAGCLDVLPTVPTTE